MIMSEFEKILVVYFFGVVVDELRGEINEHSVKPKILEVDFHVSFHDLSWLVG